MGAVTEDVTVGVEFEQLLRTMLMKQKVISTFRQLDCLFELMKHLLEPCEGSRLM